ncbi:hypothetical protein TRICI_002828 [Trichomonascus ciferrii]|uniref:Enoyl reductase (ER) domain-containing protein n=1 Tax=Trichomonascus ciferrii TaxID=44093 RepID=A0A642VAR8_9ASCO|nr:hypothetical protein TRICI_002828 [Trichomonascus ciferrii]
MSLPKEQRVYRVGPGNTIKNIELRTEKLPAIAPDDVVVKVKAAALNYRDILILTKRTHFDFKEGVVPFSDFAGEVAAKGDSVSDFAIGDSVVGNFRIKQFSGVAKRDDDSLGGSIDGGLLEYVTLPSSALNKVSKTAELTWEEMASLVCTGVTCWNALYGGGRTLRPGEVVLATGTGGVSLTGLSIAKKAGAVTVITSSSDKKLEEVKRKYSVDYGVNYKTNPEWGKEVKRLTGGADFIIENGGSGNYTQSFEAVATGGTINSVGVLQPAQQEQMPDIALLSLVKEASVRGIKVGSKELAQQLIRFTETQGLKIPIDRAFPFEKAPEAIEYLASGAHIGKVCISF